MHQKGVFSLDSASTPCDSTQPPPDAQRHADDGGCERNEPEEPARLRRAGALRIPHLHATTQETLK
eukprot:CAMPEP_0181168110 /NCGR_PEP_ID=MMETSP1096-20121128/86_1 /TAXON_ID=156174 ORGANISM="Chrysochromulina ericina, Strain CCMP281" /NCGR_SAMPLE_ID=MMETSP1096 /ASSEMBLY_ACC=CAM_ASM_000453 /LENGTH=65 /DNA_ID=CAMNT_0023255439 /DNA_START=760 /DNA_END=957 /DNA_ORIENTATION=-